MTAPAIHLCEADAWHNARKTHVACLCGAIRPQAFVTQDYREATCPSCRRVAHLYDIDKHEND